MSSLKICPVQSFKHQSRATVNAKNAVIVSSSAKNCTSNSPCWLSCQSNTSCPLTGLEHKGAFHMHLQRRVFSFLWAIKKLTATLKIPLRSESKEDQLETSSSTSVTWRLVVLFTLDQEKKKNNRRLTDANTVLASLCSLFLPFFGPHFSFFLSLFSLCS